MRLGVVHLLLQPPALQQGRAADGAILEQVGTLGAREPVLKVRVGTLKGTVSPDYKCLEVISIKSPLLGHVTPDI